MEKKNTLLFNNQQTFEIHDNSGSSKIKKIRYKGKH